MRLPKLVIVALATAALAASSATADPGHGKSSGADATKCKPANVKLMGTLTSDPGSTDTSFTMTVTKSNNAGKAYKLAGTATVNGATPELTARKVDARAPKTPKAPKADEND